MGEVSAVASNETAAGRAENRRVEVKVLLNKVLSGS
jgi:outer membrane protein OmpA-like peptidoglycan-associated protein